MSRFTCIHGIGKVSAFSLVCEVHDFDRRTTAPVRVSHPACSSESPSGKKVSRGHRYRGIPPALHPRRGRVATRKRSPKAVRSEDAAVPRPCGRRRSKARRPPEKEEGGTEDVRGVPGPTRPRSSVAREPADVSVNILPFRPNIFSPIAPSLLRRSRQRGCAASG